LKKIAIIGLGYVGLPLAVEFGKLRNVVGFDINQTRIKQLCEGYDITQECSTDQLFNATQLKYSNNLKDIRDANIYIVTVPTPIDKAKRPDLTPLLSASKLVGSILKVDDIVIYESTVFPGATEEICVPVLEKESGLAFNTDFSCGYSPERINPGDKVNILTTIKKITSGSNPKAAKEIDLLYRSIISVGTWMATSIKVAEAAKVIENSQRDLNIAFVNELSIIFERLGIDTLEVLEAAGSKWNFMPFRPGMVGGHCIGVDPYYLTHKAEEVGYNPQVILAGRRMNDNMAKYAAKMIIKRMLVKGLDVPRCRIAILGVTFKENCPDVRNSKVVDLISELQSWNAEVVVSDPWANPSDVSAEYGISLTAIENVKNIDTIVIAVGHDQYRTLSVEQLRKMCIKEKSLIADLKSIFNKSVLEAAGFEIFRL
jgi:UDP-N-acetyl-D-glucosamine/UDP-N-acetyl-D-galactosamine dehydrogenase